MAEEQVVITRRKLVLVEGKEEIRFLGALLSKIQVDDLQVLEYGGKNRLGEYMRALLCMPGFGDVVSLGVTRDADDDPRAALQSIQGTLRSAGLGIPEELGKFSGENPRVQIYLFPSGLNQGMLEDLCLQSVAEDKAIRCVDEYFDCVRKVAEREPRNLAKARVHAWLASQTEPDKRLGEAAQKGYWPLEHPVFDDLKEFLGSI